MGRTGFIFDIKKFALHDGPGIRTTVFMKGCPLRCWWCHNPESMSNNVEIGLIEHKCVGCGQCVDVCPKSALILSEMDKIQIDRQHCDGCGKCVGACFRRALEQYGKIITVEEAAQKVLEDKVFYETSGGGVTVSGGEPLLQVDFCVELFKRLQREGIHAAVDTSGAVPWELFDKIIPYTDIFLYDLKLIDSDKHKKYTGLVNKQILDNFVQLAKTSKDIEIRMPIIPGINDDLAEIKRAGAFIGGLARVPKVRLLPYHSLAGSKYDSIGLQNKMPDIKSQSTEALSNIADVLRNCGLSEILI